MRLLGWVRLVLVLLVALCNQTLLLVKHKVKQVLVWPLELVKELDQFTTHHNDKT
jgi:hypothetical protein